MLVWNWDTDAVKWHTPHVLQKFVETPSDEDDQKILFTCVFVIQSFVLIIRFKDFRQDLAQSLYFLFHLYLTPLRLSSLPDCTVCM